MSNDLLLSRARARALARFGLLSLGLLLLGACATAGKRFEQGQRLEQQGRHAEAARHYISSLRREPGLESARVRLREAGDQAIAEYLQLAESAEAARRPTEAADRMLAIDVLRQESAGVGVQLGVPADYDEQRRRALDQALEWSIQSGRSAAERQAWNDAVRHHTRAAERYQPSAEQRAALDSSHFEVVMAWGESELSASRFRAAHERAGLATALLPGDAAARERVQRLQTTALERGTQRVVVVPLWATDRVLREVSDDLLPELNDHLAHEHWSRPPLFVDVVPAAEVSRDLRRLNLHRRVLSTSEAASVGRSLGADLVVVAEVDSTFRTESDLRTTRRPARTRAGVDTAFVVEQGRQRVMARVAFVVVDPGARRVLESGTTTSNVTTDFRRARYEGDPRTLNLSRADRDLFELDGRGESERQAVRRLVDDLSPRVSRAVYDRLVRRVN
jgi:hypothetical protein